MSVRGTVTPSQDICSSTQAQKTKFQTMVLLMLSQISADDTPVYKNHFITLELNWILFYQYFNILHGCTDWSAMYTYRHFIRNTILSNAYKSQKALLKAYLTAQIYHQSCLPTIVKSLMPCCQ